MSEKKNSQATGGRSWQRRHWDRGSRQPGRCFCFSSCGWRLAHLPAPFRPRSTLLGPDRHASSHANGRLQSERATSTPSLSIHNGRHYGYYPSLRCNLVSPRIYTYTPTHAARSARQVVSKEVCVRWGSPCTRQTLRRRRRREAQKEHQSAHARNMRN